jgi:hypothetical protein
MKLVPSMVSLLMLALLSGSALAGVYKCTDSQGKTAYQASPCADEKTALEIDLKTGGATDLDARVKQQEQEKQLKKKKELELKIEQEKLKAKEAKRIKDAAEQSAINQQQIKDNPVQYSAFAIPPYQHDKLPALVKKFEARLPEIEKFRRLAAKKALATGECNRVESDELSAASLANQLIFSIDCSTAKNFQYSETELLK